MAWTQGDLDKIRAAIASGVKSVTFADGRKHEYQSVGEMLGAEKVIAAGLQMQADTVSGRKRHFTPYVKTGL